VRPIVFTVDALYTAVDLAFITYDDVKMLKKFNIFLLTMDSPGFLESPRRADINN